MSDDARTTLICAIFAAMVIFVAPTCTGSCRSDDRPCVKKETRYGMSRFGAIPFEVCTRRLGDAG